MKDEKMIFEEEVSKTYEGKMYLTFRQRNSQKARELEQTVKELISENNLTVTYAKGFLEYMRIIVDGCSHIPKQK